MKSFYVTMILFAALLLGAHSASAFTTDSSSGTNSDGSSKFSDPDEQFDNMADGNGASHSGGLHFGSTTSAIK